MRGGSNLEFLFHAQASECNHHRCVFPSLVPHGGGAEDLRGAGCGGVCALPAGARERALQPGASLPFCEDLFIERFCMTGGNSPICYLKAYHTNLYLSADAKKVQEAINEGIAAATIFSPSKDVVVSQTQLRVAFDGDAVLFSDESERIFKAHGLDRFFEHEKAHENKPLAQGPLKGFLEALGRLQKKFYSKGLRLECPIRTYLVTARSAASSGARALKTLRSWGLETDEALFLAGAPKGPLLEKIRPHIFFDDQMFHVAGAQEMGTVAAHVPYGVAQTPQRTAPVKPAPPAQ
ncbi:PREDICTED: cytosolic 5'-nucleotidase 1A isoform X6 [Chinchilla lanigera]|uniref:cytosolic 5'-nucleotidase 1A isoform X6 n=1 Tax=Chinchilla lanigera TaxID=34839 RepID=UPI00038E9688|nr:PREDICTED: cytosolic 5'-nucleotidase 1A isoform X6 [Chinchilla lanigera]